MGDHRASIKIEFEMHGVTDKVDMWINWSPDDEYGCDRRIPEWCAQVASRARAKWEEDEWEYQRGAREREIARVEQAELARLKAKYEGRTETAQKQQQPTETNVNESATDGD